MILPSSLAVLVGTLVPCSVAIPFVLNLPAVQQNCATAAQSMNSTQSFGTTLQLSNLTTPPPLGEVNALFEIRLATGYAALHDKYRFLPSEIHAIYTTVIPGPEDTLSGLADLSIQRWIGYRTYKAFFSHGAWEVTDELTIAPFGLNPYDVRNVLSMETIDAAWKQALEYGRDNHQIVDTYVTVKRFFHPPKGAGDQLFYIFKTRGAHESYSATIAIGGCDGEVYPV